MKASYNISWLLIPLLSVLSNHIGGYEEFFTFLHQLVYGNQFCSLWLLVWYYVALCYYFGYLRIMHNGIEDDSGSFLYLDLVILLCILSYLYHDLAQSNNAYWVPIILVLILHFYTFLVQIWVLDVALIVVHTGTNFQI